MDNLYLKIQPVNGALPIYWKKYGALSRYLLSINEFPLSVEHHLVSEAIRGMDIVSKFEQST